MISYFPRLALAGLMLAGSPALAQGGATAPAVTWPQQGSDLVADPAVRFGTLPNGMRYAIRRNATPPGNASVRLRIDVGSLAETEAQRGLAHFLEHMVLNGTANVPEGEFMRRLERHGLRMGADTNATTDWTQTVFKLDLPHNDAETVDTALFLLREIAGEASLTPAAIAAERPVILAEERARAGPQLNIIQDELGFALQGQPAGQRMPIGLPAVIAAATQTQLAAFYHAYYRPERATLIVVGDVDVDDMERRIRAGFGDWAGEGPAGPDPDPGTPGRRQLEARLHVEAGAPTRVSLTWARPLDRRPDGVAKRRDGYVDQLVLQILNRRLERIAATRSPSPFVAGLSIRTPIAQSADMTFLLAIAQAGQWQPALDAIETERRRLVDDGVTAEELDREIEFFGNLLGGATIGAATRPSAEIADALVASVDRGIVYTSAEEDEALFDDAMSGMSRRRINRAARAMLGGDPLIYMTAPAPVADGEAALLAAYRTAHGARIATAAAHADQIWPYTEFGTPGVVRERHVLPAPIDATTVRFANGVRLTVKHTDYDDDLILISVRAGNGRLDLPPATPLPAWEVSAALTGGGFGRISLEDADDALSQRPSSTSASVEDDAFTLTGSTRSAELDLQLQIMAAQVSDPGWRSSGWDRMRRLGDTILGAFDTTPTGILGRDGPSLLHGGDRRWAMPSPERVATTTIADLRALLEIPLKHGPVEVIMVGDIDIETAVRATAATFGALPAREDRPVPSATVAFPAPTAEPLRLTHGGRADQALAVIAWPAPDYFANLRETRALDLLSDVFTLRLLQEIRERQGLSYAPQSDHQASRTFAGYGVILSAIEAEPAALAGFLRDAQAIAADLRERPVEADELQRARLPRIETIQRGRNGNRWWLTRLARIQQDPRVATDIATEIADYQAITPADLRRAAAAYLLPDRAWSLIVVPRDGAPAPAR
jgi:zinc protease